MSHHAHIPAPLAGTQSQACSSEREKGRQITHGIEAHTEGLQ